MVPVLLAWFMVSVVVEVGSSIVLFVLLRRHGETVSFVMYGLPGYLESRYLRWCYSNGRSGRTVVILRVLSLLNVVAAAVVFIAWVTRQ